MTVWRNQALDYEPSRLRRLRHRWRYRRLLRLQRWHGGQLLKAVTAFGKAGKQETHNRDLQTEITRLRSALEQIRDTRFKTDRSTGSQHPQVRVLQRQAAAALDYRL